MNVSAEWVIVTLFLFTRCTALFLTMPLMGTTVPVQVRVMAAAVIALCLGPVVAPHVGALPQHLYELVFMMFREVLTGVLIGSAMHLVAAIMESAGAFSDMQIGLASAQMFSPATGSAATPMSRFKFMLGVVLMFVSDAHHLMLSALVGSYRAPDLTLSGMEAMVPMILQMVGQSMVLALQIAAPLAAIGVIIDLAAGFINKAVPQTQPFLLAMPAKLALGMVGMAVALPAFVAGTKAGVDLVFGGVGRIFGG